MTAGGGQSPPFCVSCLHLEKCSDFPGDGFRLLNSEIVGAVFDLGETGIAEPADGFAGRLRCQHFAEFTANQQGREVDLVDCLPELCALSPRPFPEVLPPLEYASEDQVRLVYGGGQISIRGQHVFIAKALTGQHVALKPTTTDGVVDVYYAHHRIGALDLTKPRDAQIVLQRPDHQV